MFSLGALLLFMVVVVVAFLAIFPNEYPSDDGSLTRLEVAGFVLGKKNTVDPADLARVLDKADRIAVYDSKMKPVKNRTLLYSSTDRADIESFKDAVSVSPRTCGEWFHCMCFGEELVVMYKCKRKLASLTSHHGKTIRCSLWLSDAVPVDNEKWIRWFEERGMTQLRNSRETGREAEPEHNETTTVDN